MGLLPDNSLRRHFGRKVFFQHRLPCCVFDLGVSLPEVVTEKVDKGCRHADPRLNELHVAHPGAGPPGHCVSVAGNVPRIHIPPEKAAGSAGGQDNAAGMNNHWGTSLIQCVHTADLSVLFQQIHRLQTAENRDVPSGHLLPEGPKDGLEVVFHHMGARPGGKAGLIHLEVSILFGKHSAAADLLQILQGALRLFRQNPA